MKKYVCRFAAVLMAALISCSLCACESKDANYKFGKDKIASITSVVGERTLTGTEYEGKNEFPTVEYSYQSSSVADDLSQYIQYLKEQGWTAAGADYDLATPPGLAQFVKESAEDGWILNLRLSYSENAYKIRIAKIEATISQG